IAGSGRAGRWSLGRSCPGRSIASRLKALPLNLLDRRRPHRGRIGRLRPGTSLTLSRRGLGVAEGELIQLDFESIEERVPGVHALLAKGMDLLKVHGRAVLSVFIDDLVNGIVQVPEGAFGHG